MSVSDKQLTPNGAAVADALPFGPALVQKLPRHWTGRLIERCGVSDRVVTDSVHARRHGKYKLGVHQAAILLALEHQGQQAPADLRQAAQLLA